MKKSFLLTIFSLLISTIIYSQVPQEFSYQSVIRDNTGSKKFKVFVRNDKGNVVKVNLGQKGMNIKISNPDRRKSFRARHNCDNPGPRHKARYWSCRKW